MTTAEEAKLWRDRAFTVLCVFVTVLFVSFGAYVLWAHAIQEQTASAINHPACAVRRWLKGQEARAIQATKDMTTSPSQRARAASSLVSVREFYRAERTVPPGYNCTRLLARDDAQAATKP